MKKLNNIFLYIALLNFLSALFLIFHSGYVTRIASFLFFINFVFNMNLASKKANGVL
jgi:hypothetical protein